MSTWKKFEYWYIVDEKILGYNPYWWGTCAIDNHLGENNKGLYRTILRVAKNKNRKIKIIERKIKNAQQS